ncbi:histidine phosphatase family protein [Paenibacillus piri]|uniref:Histidine phosphatase family protein n=2 Tax=Paenibacillus piri TaxID=2547395 RepID=A0A4R5K7K7_9BACL|nr:histidine phosphatase family protein [Paenibacillus piri]
MAKLFIYVFVILFAATEVAAHEAPTGEDSSLLRAIEKGGYILYLRHGEATVGEDQTELNFNDCRTQRNLSEHGRDQARAFGVIYGKQLIPIRYPVMSSPYCRARETAEIIFGKQNVVVAPVLASIEKLRIESYPAEKKQQILSDLSKIFETPPAHGTNTVIVAHTFLPHVALGDIPNLGTVIIKPKGTGRGYEIVGRISFDQFIQLTQDLNTSHIRR